MPQEHRTRFLLPKTRWSGNLLTGYPIPRNLAFDMNKSRLEFKVGLFILLCLALLVVLFLSFSKEMTSFRPKYSIHLRAANAGGLKKGAVVLMSGGQVGALYGIVLGAEATNVTITLRIYIHSLLPN